MICKCSTYIALKGILLVLGRLRHDDVMETLTNQILRVISRAYLQSRPPRKLNVHRPGLLIVSPLNSPVHPQAKLDNHVIPYDPKLLLPQVIGRADKPNSSIRIQQLRLSVSPRHLTLAEPPSTTRDTEAGLRIV